MINTITRKIQILLTGDIKEGYRKLYDWDKQCSRAANIAMSHLFFQNKMSEFFYLTDSAKILFADINKADPEKDNSAERVLNTSKQNTTYRVLSSNFKGSIPADIFSNLNSRLASKFNKEKDEYYYGTRSLSSYKRGMPMPISSTSIRNIKPTENKRNYFFELLGLSFRTHFGKDLSGNRIIFDRALAGEYKLCNSSIQLKKNKIYLLAVFQFEGDKFKLSPKKVAHAELSIDYPIILSCGIQKWYIGYRDEYLHRRLAIQAARRRQQISAKYNLNGKGRKKKLSNTDRFQKAETDYVNTRQHQYTFKMIDFCLKNKCAKLILKLAPDVKVPENLTKREEAEWRLQNEFLLRNWGYLGLKNKILYKAKKVGIEVIVEEPEKTEADEELETTKETELFA